MGEFTLVITPQLKCSVIILNSSRLIFQTLSSPDLCCSTKYTPLGSGALLWNLISNSEEGPGGRVQFSSVAQSCPTLCNTMNHSTPGLLSITSSRSLPKLVSIESVMPSNHLILCHPLLLLPSIFPSIRVCSNESALHIKWPKYWSFSFNISPSSEHPGLIFRIDWLDLLAVQGTLNGLLQLHSSKSSILQCSAFFISPSLTSIHDYWKKYSLD